MVSPLRHSPVQFSSDGSCASRKFLNRRLDGAGDENLQPDTQLPTAYNVTERMPNSCKGSNRLLQENGGCGGNRCLNMRLSTVDRFSILNNDFRQFCFYCVWWLSTKNYCKTVLEFLLCDFTVLTNQIFLQKIEDGASVTCSDFFIFCTASESIE